MPYTDLFLYDVKCFSDSIHKEGTGVSNKLILENLEKLSVCFEGDIIIRIPVIKGFNADEAEMKIIADFLDGKKHKKLELLPYHKMGEHKYEALNMDINKFYVPQKDEIEKYSRFFNKSVI